MFYRLDESGNIIDCAKFKYNDKCLETSKNIIRSYNGKLIFEEETNTEYYKKAKSNYDLKLNAKIEIENIKKWFDNEYTKNEQKYRRFNTLQMVCEDGISPTNKLIDLYNEAETKRKRIQELEVLINE